MNVIALLSLDLSPAGGGRAIEHQPSAPLLAATDLAATRGDGVFETIVVVDGVPQAMQAHLDRFARSARLLDLPAPEPAPWRAAIDILAAKLRPYPRGAVKYVLTRGDEAGEGAPTGWALAFIPAVRPAGPPAPVRAVTLDRGYRSDVAETSPWLLQGAKTLSYAVNMAALREARRRDADDVIFVSSDGLVLEGPTSTVIARVDGVYTTPPVDLGILPGTTQGDAFRALEDAGLPVAVRRFDIDALRRADALWMCSSTRGAAPVIALDGTEREIDDAVTALANTALDDRRG